MAELLDHPRPSATDAAVADLDLDEDDEHGGPPIDGDGRDDDDGGDDGGDDDDGADEGDHDDTPWVTVATYWTPTDAQIARSA